MSELDERFSRLRDQFRNAAGNRKFDRATKETVLAHIAEDMLNMATQAIRERGLGAFQDVMMITGFLDKGGEAEYLLRTAFNPRVRIDPEKLRCLTGDGLAVRTIDRVRHVRHHLVYSA